MFKKYSSLINVKDSVVNKMITEGLVTNGKPYVCTEKIHGTNFSAIYNRGEITWAKRTAPIGESEKFYQYECIVKRYANNVQRLAKTIIYHRIGGAADDAVIQVYGEYAGTHEDGSRVQKQVEYGPANWYVFDIKVDGVYLPPMMVQQVCNIADMTFVPVLAIGTLQECFMVPNDLQSVVQKYQDYVEYSIEPGTDNIAEGTVIRAWGEVDYFLNGELAVIKNKNAKFKEKDNAKKLDKIVVDLSESDTQLLAELKSYLTAPRLSNVLSHIGTPTVKQFGMVQGKLAQDALKDFEKDVEAVFFEAFENPTRVKKLFMNDAAMLVREHWTDILEGQF